MKMKISLVVKDLSASIARMVDFFHVWMDFLHVLLQVNRRVGGVTAIPTLVITFNLEMSGVVNFAMLMYFPGKPRSEVAQSAFKDVFSLVFYLVQSFKMFRQICSGILLK